MLWDAYPFLVHVTSKAGLEGIRRDGAIRPRIASRNVDAARQTLCRALGTEFARGPLVANLCWFVATKENPSADVPSWGEARVVLDTRSALRSLVADFEPFYAMSMGGGIYVTSTAGADALLAENPGLAKSMDVRDAFRVDLPYVVYNGTTVVTPFPMRVAMRDFGK